MLPHGRPFNRRVSCRQFLTRDFTQNLILMNLISHREERGDPTTKRRSQKSFKKLFSLSHKIFFLVSQKTFCKIFSRHAKNFLKTFYKFFCVRSKFFCVLHKIFLKTFAIFFAIACCKKFVVTQNFFMFFLLAIDEEGHMQMNRV